MSSGSNIHKDPIAIVGSACRFAGQATTPSKLWDLLRQPRDIASEIPRSRFDVEKFYHPDALHHGTSNGQSRVALTHFMRLSGTYC